MYILSFLIPTTSTSSTAHSETASSKQPAAETKKKGKGNVFQITLTSVHVTMQLLYNLLQTDGDKGDALQNVLFLTDVCSKPDGNSESRTHFGPQEIMYNVFRKNNPQIIK